MEPLLSLLKESTLVSTVARLALALLLGSMLGIERGRKRRPAGLKTYAIVCMASALVMITGEYMFTTYGSGDPSRLGAQVISGIGFLGAGTIIITSRQVRGLTTAAALWAAACMGLAAGAGFYSGAIICGVFVLITMSGLSKLDARLRRHSRQISYFMEFRSVEPLNHFISLLQERGYHLDDVKLENGKENATGTVGATLWFELTPSTSHVELIKMLTGADGVLHLEECELL